MNTYYVELNFSGSNTIDTGIAVSQGDYGKVQLSIACKKDGQFISDAESAEIIFQTEKGKVINGDLTGSGGLYGYVFQGNELQDPGKLVATVTLHYEDGQTSSESFLMAVRYNPLYDQNLQAGPYITQLEKLQAQAQGYVDYIGAIIEQLRQDIGETALTKADLQNDFLQSAPGLKALDAALGPQILQKSNVVNNLLATVTGNVLDATQGKALNEKITQLYSKFPDDKSYFTAVIPRVIDITSRADQPTLRLDIEYMIQTKGIKSGEYGFSSIQYTDLPASASEWGYVKYFQHADNFVTVMVFPDGLTGGILLNQFIIGQNKWSTTWKKWELSEAS